MTVVAMIARRKASKDVRRQQLVDATIACLARKGYAALTVADVAGAAGLSVGIINFHFESKDRLLSACLQSLSDEYSRAWKEAVRSAKPTAAGRLGAMMLADFDDAIFTPDKIAAWIAFWGESQGRPVYDRICQATDKEHSDVLTGLCAEVIREDDYGHDPALAAVALDSMTDGLWLAARGAEWRRHPGAYAGIARQTTQAALAAFFPRHFGPGR